MHPEAPEPRARTGPRITTRLGTALWCATLLTLPWIGADLIILISGRDGGAGLQPSWVLMAMTWLVSGPGRHRAAVPRSWRRIMGLGAAALLVSAAGMLVAPAPVAGAAAATRFLKQLVQLAVMAAFALWPLAHLRGVAAWRRTARWLVVGALLQAGYGLLQQWDYHQPLAAMRGLEGVFTSNPSILSGSKEVYVGNRFLDIPRLRGTACEPLYLGNYLLLAVPMIALTGWSRLVRGGAAAVLSLLLLLTWSRGAWIGAVGAAGVAAWWVWPALTPAGRRACRTGLLVGAGVAGGLVIAALALGWEAPLLPARRLAQTFSTHDWSNLTRLYSLQAAWRAFLLSPVVGIGWGQFGWHFPALVDPAGLQAMFTWPVVANFPLLVLCETGLIGFSALLLGAVGLARAAIGWRRAASPVVGTLLAAGAGIAIQTMTFSQYNLPHAWVALGLLAAAVLDRRRGPIGGGDT